MIKKLKIAILVFVVVCVIGMIAVFLQIEKIEEQDLYIEVIEENTVEREQYVEKLHETIERQEKMVEVLEKENISLKDQIWNMRNQEMKEPD